MSRTDKDRPYTVQAADPYQPGRYAFHGTRRWGSSHVHGESECDLPDYHDRTPEPTYHLLKSGRLAHVCSWELEHWVFSPFGTPPREYRASRWHNPERVRERDGLRAARRHYNAGDDLADFDFPCWQTRSSARWDWE